MPDVWEIVKSNSSLPSGDFWEHLNNQEGGGPGGSITLLDGLEVAMSDCCYAVEIDFPDFTVEIDIEFVIEIETDEFEVEVC